MFSNRLTIVTGHYGSGKTTFSINLALSAARAGRRTCLADMDIVNPYFRAADSERPLREAGVTLIKPLFAGTNLDSPALPAQLAAVFDDRSFESVVLDVGGDDAGAAALGVYSARILADRDYAHLYVLNARRPLIAAPEDAAALLRQIETVSRVPATALVNNTNLGPETDADVLAGSRAYADAVSRLCGLPVACTCVRADLAETAARAAGPVFPMELWVKPPWAPPGRAQA